MSDTSIYIETMVKSGFTMRLPAPRGSILDRRAVDGLVGTSTWINAYALGLPTRVQMKIASAEVVDGGRAINLHLVPLSQKDPSDTQFSEPE